MTFHNRESRAVEQWVDESEIIDPDEPWGISTEMV